MKKIVLICLLASAIFASVTRDDTKGVVIDTANNLMWQDDEVKSYNYTNGQQYCMYLNLSGFYDWRLPTTYELSIMYNNIKVFKAKTKYTDYWSNGGKYIAYSNGNYEARGYSPSNVRCVRKIKEEEKSNRFKVMIKQAIIKPIKEKHYDDGLNDSCNKKIKNEIPKKPQIEKYKKRDYETKDEFEESKKRTLDRWKAKINSYEKECRFKAKMIKYIPREDMVMFKYDIKLDGLREVEEKRPMSDAQADDYYEQGKEITLTAILKQNQKEKFYIEKIIYPKEKFKKQQNKKLVNRSVVSGILIEELRVKKHRKGEKVKNRWIEKNQKISYDYKHKKILEPLKYKDFTYTKKPKLKKELIVTVLGDRDENSTVVDVSIKIDSNFKIFSVDWKTNNKDFMKIDFFKNQFQKLSKQGYVETNQFPVENKKFTIKIKDVDSFSAVYDCNLSKCTERTSDI